MLKRCLCTTFSWPISASSHKFPKGDWGIVVSPNVKALIFLIAALVALGGFAILELPKAMLWLLFIALAYPVLIASLSSSLDGTRFTAKEIISIYRESLRALPALFASLKDMLPHDKP